ncbi:MAG: YdbH domain-containing protein [Alphaproteobacteria bacterium]|nr:YdbH domain-containing protein [Alphaproteobacteria bacterium]MBU2096252.1 YdbH domain-containing protein [Alphaproteobacteria bacterium]MBU2151206.1 YdbH domain-containing protein [Alphaproteobacteria bacterium]MBU2307135.1 YdbH domain-containing protein [Alphaproteobacteria bacterium]MBU2361393.1 YdbH domain-containing protein [Alphaproteobacteria bacterium]
MTDDAIPTRPKPRPGRTLLRILAVLGVVLLIAVGLIWLNRKALAREALTGWLRAKGIPADAQVEAFGPSVFTARLRIGDPKNPDFVAERAEVRYRARITGLDVVSVTLRKPVLRAQLRQDGLHVGALDPLVQEFLRRPPQPNAAQPLIRIDDGLLMLTTDYGPVRLAADAVVEDGKLQSLAATSAPARLRSPAFDVALGEGVLKATTRAGRIDIALAAPVTAAKAGAAELAEGRVSLVAQLPYPDFQKRRGDGAVVAALGVTGKRITVAGQVLDGAELKAGLTGQATGWIPDLAVSGKATASVLATAGRFGATEAKAIRLAAVSNDLRWTRKRGDRVAGTLKLNGGVEGLTAGDLKLAAFTVTAGGPVAASATAFEAALDGAAVGQGGWSGLGAVTAQDTPDIAAIKRAARSFRIAAPGVAVRLKGGAATVSLPKPVRVATASGGTVELAGRPGAPVFGPSGGAFKLAVKGGGLPAIDADIARLTVADGGAVAAGRVQARASVGFVQNADLDAAGRLQIAGGGLTFTAERCVAIKADRLDFGANDIERLSGRLCPAGGPLFRMTGADWRIAGRVEAAAASAPFIEGRVVGGAGRIEAQSRRGQVTAKAHIDTARQEDTGAQTRFTPFLMSGDASLSEFIWRADLDFKRPNGDPLGNALVTQDGRLGLGVVVIETEMLTFADGGLQPAQLSPMAAAVGSPVVGSAKFKGRFDWTPAGSTSSGTISIPSLDFRSPAGPVTGLKGELAFSSLAPLVAAPGQELTIDRVQGFVLLEHLRAKFAVSDNLLRVEGGEADVGGGKVTVETLEIPLVPGAPTRGILRLDGVQLHDLVEASPFGDKVDLDAKVSGTIPFEVTGNKVRISGGDLRAVQPGRLSIDRSALTGVATDSPLATPAPAAAPNPSDTFSDFAYQAMENLAFSTLEATIKSQEDGRLGVLFHIIGKHDPPTKQQIKLSLMDLIQQKFLGKPLPLPSGTGVNLTLDTTLNLDDLLADYANYQSLHHSAPVQP